MPLAFVLHSCRKYPVLRPVKKKNKSDDSQGSSPLESSTTSTQSISKKSDEAPVKWVIGYVIEILVKTSLELGD